MAQYRSPWLDLPGAVEAEAPDAGVASHYGEPLREQRHLLSGGIVDLSHRSTISLQGPDRLSWLDSISSQQLINLQPGESSETLILDPNGRIEHQLKLLDDGKTLWVITENAERLLGWLQKMKFRADVEIADRSADFAVIGSIAQESHPGVEPEAHQSNGAALHWRDPWRSIAPGGYSYAVDEVQHPARDWHWRETIIDRTTFAELPKTLGVSIVGIIAAEALRIEAWRPRLALEGDERILPHELDLLRSAVHMSKGCYRGQETVAKVHNLGRPPRRLTFLHLDGSKSSLPNPGAEIFAADGEKVVGTVTSSAWHYELGPVALALLRRGVNPDETLRVVTQEEQIDASQEVIVSPEAGATAQITLKKRRLA